MGDSGFAVSQSRITRYFRRFCNLKSGIPKSALSRFRSLSKRSQRALRFLHCTLVDELTKLVPEALIKVVDLRGLFQFPAVAYVQLGVCHSIHHRGQLSMYLRPMGAKVPSIYGESYDARVAREAGA